MNDDRAELLIEVYTDPMCPWCYVGAAQLQKTLTSDDYKQKVAPYMRAVIKLRPYLLDNRLPATSFTPPEDRYDLSSAAQDGKPPTKKEYYSKKFSNMDAFDAKIAKAASQLDLPKFEWLTDGKVGATWLAHRLLWKALDEQEKSEQEQEQPSSKSNVQEKLAMCLYQAFHAQSQDMSDVDTLAKIAQECGVFANEQDAVDWMLKSDEGDDEVRHAMDMGVRNGVQSIPFTILQDGSDHSSEVLDHDTLMRMFDMQASMHK